MKPMDDLMLPPLPEPVANISASNPVSGIGFVKPDKDYFTADQMREYATSAVEAFQQAHTCYPKGEVVGPCVCGSWPGGKCLRCPPLD